MEGQLQVYEMFSTQGFVQPRPSEDDAGLLHDTNLCICWRVNIVDAQDTKISFEMSLSQACHLGDDSRISQTAYHLPGTRLGLRCGIVSLDDGTCYTGREIGEWQRHSALVLGTGFALYLMSTARNELEHTSSMVIIQ